MARGVTRPCNHEGRGSDDTGHVSQGSSGLFSLGRWFHLIAIVLAMLFIMVLAGGIVLYVAFPHRGEEMPHTPWVGTVMRKSVDRLPTLDNQRDRPHN